MDEPNAEKSDSPVKELLSLEDFVKGISPGLWDISGVYVPDVLALRVRRSESHTNPAHINTTPNEVTLFGTAENYGCTWLMSHLEDAGASFYGIDTGVPVYVIGRYGKTMEYVVQQKQIYLLRDIDSSSIGIASTDHYTRSSYTSRETYHEVDSSLIYGNPSPGVYLIKGDDSLNGSKGINCSELFNRMCRKNTLVIQTCAQIFSESKEGTYKGENNNGRMFITAEPVISSACNQPDELNSIHDQPYREAISELQGRCDSSIYSIFSRFSNWLQGK